MYKSKVEIHVGQKVFEDMKRYFKENGFIPDIEEEDSDGHKLTYKWCEWSPTHREVRDVMHILDRYKSAPITKKESAYCLVRIGEEPGDIEVVVNDAGRAHMKSAKESFGETNIVSMLEQFSIPGKTPLLYFRENVSFLTWNTYEEEKLIRYEVFSFENSTVNIEEAGEIAMEMSQTMAQAGYAVLQFLYGDNIPNFTVLQ